MIEFIEKGTARGEAAVLFQILKHNPDLSIKEIEETVKLGDVFFNQKMNLIHVALPNAESCFIGQQVCSLEEINRCQLELGLIKMVIPVKELFMLKKTYQMGHAICLQCQRGKFRFFDNNGDFYDSIAVLMNLHQKKSCS
jgi:hypothetical protein